MSKAPQLRRVLETVPPVAIECSAAGEVVLLLGTDNVARAIDRQGRELARVEEYLPGDVLLHPDGRRLITTRRHGALERVTVLPLDGGAPRSFDVAVVDEDPDEYDDDYDPADVVGEHLESMAEDLTPGWAGRRRDSPDFFVQERIDMNEEGGPHWSVAEQASIYWGPALPIQSALDPSGERLAVSAGDVAIVSLDRGEVVRRIESAGGVDVFALFDHGEAVHTVYFDQLGQLCTMGLWVSGNPFTRLGCFDADSGRARSQHEVGSQTWWVEGAEPVRLSGSEAGGIVPSEVFPPQGHLACFSGRHVEVWTREGLVRSVLRPPQSVLVPQFCISGFNHELLTAIVTPTDIEVRDLVSDTSRARTSFPFEGGSREARWYQWSPARGYLVVVCEGGLWLWAPGDDRWWSLCAPSDADLLAWAMSDDDRWLWLVDAEGGLWTCELPDGLRDVFPEPSSAASDPAEG